MPPRDDAESEQPESFDDQDEAAADATALETEAEVNCPHCGETLTIALDPAGGRSQDYVEDCEVCCRPWRVKLWYDASGAAEVQVQAVD
jgi:transposase-like protein